MRKLFHLLFLFIASLSVAQNPGTVNEQFFPVKGLHIKSVSHFDGDKAGNVVIAGDLFSKVNGVIIKGLARVDSLGNFDESFSPKINETEQLGIEQVDHINDSLILVLTDGKIILLGTKGNVIRQINPDPIVVDEFIVSEDNYIFYTTKIGQQWVISKVDDSGTKDPGFSEISSTKYKENLQCFGDYFFFSTASEVHINNNDGSSVKILSIPPAKYIVGYTGSRNANVIYTFENAFLDVRLIHYNHATQQESDITNKKKDRGNYLFNFTSDREGDFYFLESDNQWIEKQYIIKIDNDGSVAQEAEYNLIYANSSYSSFPPVLDGSILCPAISGVIRISTDLEVDEAFNRNISTGFRNHEFMVSYSDSSLLAFNTDFQSFSVVGYDNDIKPGFNVSEALLDSTKFFLFSRENLINDSLGNFYIVASNNSHRPIGVMAFDANGILRYFYPTESNDYLREFTVDENGVVYLIFGSGKVLKYFEGAQDTTFELENVVFLKASGDFLYTFSKDKVFSKINKNTLEKAPGFTDFSIPEASYFYSINPLDNGDFVVGYRLSGSFSSEVLGKYDKNGNVAPTFTKIITSKIDAFKGIDSEGRIYLFEDERLKRRTVNGVLDPSFIPGDVGEGTIIGVMDVGNDQLLVYGDFSEYNGVAARSVIMLHNDQVTSIGEREFNQALKLYPNPQASNQNIKIEVPASMANVREVVLTILDTKGSTVHQEQLAPSGSRITVKTPVQPGIYFVKLVSGTESLSTLLLVE